MKHYLKPILFSIAILFVIGMCTPVYALSSPYSNVESDKIQYIREFIGIYNNFREKWFGGNSTDLPEVPDMSEDDSGDDDELIIVEIEVPRISEATYCHKNAAYSGFDNHLQITWNSIDDADSYDVEIVKADGSSHTYSTTGNCLYLKAGCDEFLTGCPKIYVEETSTWIAATVRVRAVDEGIVGEWSDTVKISCNAMHF